MAAHQKFAHLRTSGEWFLSAPELLDFIESIKGGTSWPAPKAPPLLPAVKIALSPMDDLKALATQLRRQRPTLPANAEPHASNLIQQISNIKTPEDAQRLKPFMAESTRRLRLAMH